MAVKDDETIKKEVTCQGHRVCYDFSVKDISAKQTWPFKKAYQTHCKVLPTSWTFELLFQYIPDNGNVSCYVTLSRKDTINIPVKALIWLRFSIPKDQPYFVLHKILRKHEILPNYEIKKSIVNILPPPEVGTIFDQELVVAVILRIRNCRSNVAMDPAITVSEDI